ncbi:MAG TPA: UDP-N-acetylmuramoyl-L-alanine--D-glutamate ligase, partial [Nitrosospira sp.]
MVDIKGKRVVVLGLGDTGLSMARWLVSRGAEVRAADTRAEPPRLKEVGALLPEAALHLGGPFSDQLFHGIDLIAV